MPLMIAGTHSGAGKSTVTIGILAAMKKRGLKVQPFKAGPDFIDTGLHGLATGVKSRNLDIWMCGTDYVKDCIARHSYGVDCAVIEGVMGLYDGGDRSACALAEAVGAEVVLVIDAYGMAESAGAIVKGFNEYGGRKKIAGVILNRIGSERHYGRVKDSIKGVDVLGYIPRDADLEIPSRHLGLMTAEELGGGKGIFDKLEEAVESHIDMNALIELSKPGSSCEIPAPEVPVSVRIGIARDEAFCFYYEDNIDMLREAGAEIIKFSPLKDSSLPERLDCLYIGGGYPEEHAGKLSENKSMLDSIRDFSLSGKPVYAECGGMMCLSEGIEKDGAYYPMAGVFPFKSVMRGKRAALGYREIKNSEDTILGPKDSMLRGHEFHYSEAVSARNIEGVRYNILGEDESSVCSAMFKKTLGSYTHIHLGSRLNAARDFVSYIKGEGWK